MPPPRVLSGCLGSPCEEWWELAGAVGFWGSAFLFALQAAPTASCSPSPEVDIVRNPTELFLSCSEGLDEMYFEIMSVFWFYREFRSVEFWRVLLVICVCKSVCLGGRGVTTGTL